MILIQLVKGISVLVCLKISSGDFNIPSTMRTTVLVKSGAHCLLSVVNLSPSLLFLI